MNIKPMVVATLLGIGAVSMTALSGCASMHPARDQPADADAAAPAPAPAPADNAAPADSAAAASPAAAPAAATPVATDEAPQAVVPDGQLQARVKSALAKHNLETAHIGVRAREGVVHLSGAVASGVQIDQAQSVVSEVDGVLEVDNQLKVSRK